MHPRSAMARLHPALASPRRYFTATPRARRAPALRDGRATAPEHEGYQHHQSGFQHKPHPHLLALLYRVPGQLSHLDSGSGGYGGYGGYGMNYGNSYYSSAHLGSYMNSGTGFGNQYGQLLFPAAAIRPIPRAMAHSPTSPPLSGMQRSARAFRPGASMSGRREGDGDTDGGDPEAGGGDTDSSTDTTSAHPQHQALLACSSPRWTGWTSKYTATTAGGQLAGSDPLYQRGPRVHLLALGI